MDSCNVLSSVIILRKWPLRERTRDVSEQTLQSWNERVREITRGCVQRIYGTWLNPEAFGEVYLVQA